MKRKFALFLVIAPCLLGLAILARAQTYDLSWFKIAGGGGTSTGGVYTLSGTIGQPDAGHMSGGNYSLDGGFWAFIAAVQTPGAPLLTVKIVSTNAIISWPTPPTAFTLQQNGNLSTTNWSTVSQTVVTNAGTNSVTVPAIGSLYFRLKQ